MSESTAELINGQGKEQAKQQLEADEICRGMRIDCEDLLKARGIVKKRPILTRPILVLTPFEKSTVLESSILDDNGEPIKLTLFSMKIDPAKSNEIIVGAGNLRSNKPFLSLEKDHGSIEAFEDIRTARLGPAKSKRRANLQDAREWKKVVDALKEQNRASQSSPIEHK